MKGIQTPMLTLICLGDFIFAPIIYYILLVPKIKSNLKNIDAHLHKNANLIPKDDFGLLLNNVRRDYCENSKRSLGN